MTKYPLYLNEGFDFVCLNLNEDSFPLLASGSVLALLKYSLWGMLAKHGASSWVLSAQRQLGNTRPVFPNLRSCSASPGPGAEWGGRCLSVARQHRRGSAVSGAAAAFRAPSGVWDGDFVHIQVEAVKASNLCWWDFFVSSTSEIAQYFPTSLCLTPVSPTDC